MKICKIVETNLFIKEIQLSISNQSFWNLQRVRGKKYEKMRSPKYVEIGSIGECVISWFYIDCVTRGKRFVERNGILAVWIDWTMCRVPLFICKLLSFAQTNSEFFIQCTELKSIYTHRSNLVFSHTSSGLHQCAKQFDVWSLMTDEVVYHRINRCASVTLSSNLKLPE